jgi:dimethylamine monooxygenase subunit A
MTELLAVSLEHWLLSGEKSIRLVYGICVAVVLVLASFLLWWRHFTTTLPSTSGKEVPSKKKQQSTRRPICPYSAESNFIVETAEDLLPTPLELLESWVDPFHPDFGKYPLGVRWLEAGLSGQDTPGMLRAGLRRLKDSKYFLVEEPYRLKEELELKRKALDDPFRFPLVFVAETDAQCLQAQQECLELFLHHLPRRYPDLYSYDKHKNTIHVKPINTTFQIDDYKERPLELCERIVQEDLVLMRPPKPNTDEKQFAMAAAAVVFSFHQLPEKLGQSMSFIHAPVPEYEKQLHRTLDITFSKLLKVEAPMWRNNWGLAGSGGLEEPWLRYGSSPAKQHPDFIAASFTYTDVEAMYLQVEYQTIRRLPASGYLLFTIRTMADPMSSLKQTPKAAACLAKSIRGMSFNMRVYKGIQNDDICKVVLEYLDGIAKNTDRGEGNEKDADVGVGRSTSSASDLYTE